MFSYACVCVCLVFLILCSFLSLSFFLALYISFSTSNDRTFLCATQNIEDHFYSHIHIPFKHILYKCHILVNLIYNLSTDIFIYTTHYTNMPKRVFHIYSNKFRKDVAVLIFFVFRFWTFFCTVEI